MSPRLRRAEQVERNREVVLAAARRVFLVKGYAGATVDAIAEQAGFSKGVVYSQFESKADMFLALLERRITERGQENERLTGKLGTREAVRALIRTAARDAESDPGWQALLVEFRLVAARDPVLNKRYAALHAKTIALLASLFESTHERDGTEPPFPPRVMGEMVMALGIGVTLERLANEQALPTKHAEEMLMSALGAATTKGKER